MTTRACAEEFEPAAAHLALGAVGDERELALLGFTWDNAGMCDAGDPQSAEWWGKQPFEDLFGASEAACGGPPHRGRARRDDDSRESTSRGSARKLARSYSNADLWELFRPDGDDIPYVYDQLAAWGTCDWDPLAVLLARRHLVAMLPPTSSSSF